MKKIQIGETFTYTDKFGNKNTHERLPDAEKPVFESERIQLKHIHNSLNRKMQSYIFGTEPAWFVQRGMQAA